MVGIDPLPNDFQEKTSLNYEERRIYFRAIQPSRVPHDTFITEQNAPYVSPQRRRHAVSVPRDVLVYIIDFVGVIPSLGGSIRNSPSHESTSPRVSSLFVSMIPVSGGSSFQGPYVIGASLGRHIFIKRYVRKENRFWLRTFLRLPRSVVAPLGAVLLTPRPKMRLT